MAKARKAAEANMFFLDVMKRRALKFDVFRKKECEVLLVRCWPVKI